MHRCHDPKNYEYDVVGGIGDGVIWASSPSEIDGKKACGHRESAWNDICGVAGIQNEVKGSCDGGGENEGEDQLFF